MLKNLSLDPLSFISTPGLAWQAALKKTELQLLTDIDMLLMVEKWIRGVWHAIHQYAKANDKYMEDYDKIEESSNIKYWDVNNLYGSAMLKNPPVNNFEYIENTSPLKRIITKWVMKDIFLKLIFNILKIYINLIMIYNFYQKIMKNGKFEKLVSNLHDKTEYVIYIRNLKKLWKFIE